MANDSQIAFNIKIDELIARESRRRSRMAQLQGWDTTPETAEKNIRSELIRHLRGRQAASKP